MLFPSRGTDSHILTRECGGGDGGSVPVLAEGCRC